MENPDKIECNASQLRAVIRRALSDHKAGKRNLGSRWIYVPIDPQMSDWTEYEFAPVTKTRMHHLLSSFDRRSPGKFTYWWSGDSLHVIGHNWD